MTDISEPAQEPTEELVPLEALQERVHRLSVEVKARTGRGLPISSIQFECLLDMILAPGTPERDTFERVSLSKALLIGEEMLTRATREQLLRR